MTYKNNVAVKVAILLFLVGITATTVDARINPNTIINQLLMNGNGNYLAKSSTTAACCDLCLCAMSNPPRCQCRDIGETCHSACKSCVCTRSYPPQCSCDDINYFCYDPCSGSVAKAH